MESRRIRPIFPLLFHDRFSFSKIFTRIVSLTELQHSLEQEFLYAELIQWATPVSRGIILATFEINLADLLYPAPCFKGLLAGVDVDLLMEPTKYFPVCSSHFIFCCPDKAKISQLPLLSTGYYSAQNRNFHQNSCRGGAGSLRHKYEQMLCHQSKNA